MNRTRLAEFSFPRRCGYVLMLIIAVGALGCAWLSSAHAAPAAPAPDQAQIDSLYLEARLAMSTHRYAQAADCLDEALTKDSCPPWVYEARAEVYAQSANGVEAARKIIEQGLKLYPDEPRLLIQQARIEEQAGKIEEAIVLLERVLKKQPHRRSVLERLSQLHLKRFRFIQNNDQLQREIASLIDVYQRMLAGSRGVERVPPLLVLSSLYQRVNKGDEALKMAKEAAMLRPNDPRPHLALASVHQFLNRPADALTAYRRALQINPSMEDAINGVAQILNNNPDRLVEFYRGLSEERPNVAPVQLQYAQVLIQARRWKDAETVLRAILAKRPDQAKASTLLITVLRAQNRTADALEAGRAALETDPENKDFLNAEAETLRELKTPEARAEWYRKLIEDFAGQKDVQLLIARELVRDERWPEAEKQLEAVLKQWPSDMPSRLARVRVWLALNKTDKAVAEARELSRQKNEFATVVTLAVAENMHSRKRTDEALKFIDEMRAMRPDDEGLAVWNGWLLFNINRAGDAIALLEKFRAAHPASYDVISVLAESYADQGKFERAEAILDSAPKSLLESRGEDMLLLRANLDRRRNKLPEALATLQQLVKRNPKNAAYQQQVGIVLQQMGRNSEAENAYMRAIELDPNDPENYNTLGYFYAETNQKLDVALDLVTRALQIKPDAGHIVDSLGWVYYQRGEYPKAVEALVRAVKLMGDRPDAVILEHLGDAYSKTGNKVSAREAWSKALELKPEKPEQLKKKIEAVK